MADITPKVTKPQILFDDTYKGKRYTYGLTYRPVGYAQIPEGWIIKSDKPSARFTHGTIDYPRPLTQEEITQYQLTPLIPEVVIPKAEAGMLLQTHGNITIAPAKAQQILEAGRRQLSPEEFEELESLLLDLEIYGFSQWINVRLGTLMSKIEWELEIEPSPVFSEALPACDYAFLGEELKRMCRDAFLSPVGHKKQLCQRLYNAGVPEVVAVMEPHLKEKQEKAIYTVPGWSEVKGIFVGGCVKRGVGSSFRAKAHAHNMKTDKFFGWICVRSLKRVGEIQGKTIVKPSRLLRHEYAHILTPDHYHDDIWRSKMGELGQTIPKQYEKKKR